MSSRILLQIRIQINTTNNLDYWMRTNTSQTRRGEVCAANIAKGNILDGIEAEF